jgi:hypothetical protein
MYSRLSRCHGVISVRTSRVIHQSPLSTFRPIVGTWASILRVLDTHLSSFLLHNLLFLLLLKRRIHRFSVSIEVSLHRSCLAAHSIVAESWNIGLLLFIREWLTVRYSCLAVDISCRFGRVFDLTQHTSVLLIERDVSLLWRHSTRSEPVLVLLDIHTFILHEDTTTSSF